MSWCGCAPPETAHESLESLVGHVHRRPQRACGGLRTNREVKERTRAWANPDSEPSRPRGVVMIVHEMTEDECRSALARVSFGRLACAHDGQPYVVPIYFSYDGTHLYGLSAPGQIYGFSTLGQKIEWMRANPLVCVEIDDHTSHNEWMSVVV